MSYDYAELDDLIRSARGGLYPASNLRTLLRQVETEVSMCAAVPDYADRTLLGERVARICGLLAEVERR
ncbi:hypothetical protein FHU33_3917 [Blastococcus colisei]|uniref:Uncharacterized protein n=1 Tax=Blastococcus colisei TaxID=1564162 RepID=A0A543PK15_9ACTN|nr:hypothetical protein [Blastococcus colisei]TQN44415.1 hypothetical protein FHU33_3917 [Blastococcus colisei]